MKKVFMKVATYMLAIAGLTTVFTSCNEENEEVMNRKANYKSSISSGSNPYAFYEDNDYSVYEIFSKAAVFGEQFKNNAVENMSIVDAVAVLETYWNYAVVAKQTATTGTPYPKQEFTFSVAKVGTDSISGLVLNTNFRTFLLSVKQQMNHNVLNMGDISVVNESNTEIVFKLTLFPFDGERDILIDNIFPKVDVVKDTNETCFLPNSFSIDPNDYPEPSENTAKEITGMSRYLTKQKYGVVADIRNNVSFAKDTLNSWIYDTDTCQILKEVQTLGNNNVWGYYSEIPASKLKSYVIPRMLKSVKRTWDNLDVLIDMVPWGHRISMATKSRIETLFHSIYPGVIHAIGEPVGTMSIPSEEVFSYRIGECEYGKMEENPVWWPDLSEKLTLPDDLQNYMNSHEDIE